jgi:hypothetical protein
VYLTARAGFMQTDAPQLHEGIIMGQSTFSGPVRAGSIPNTTGTTVGTNVANVGYMLMAQSGTVDIIGATSLNQLIATIPANSQIVDVILNVAVDSNDDTGATVSVGTAADATAFIPATSSQTPGTTRGTLTTAVATDVGATDIQVFANFTAVVGDGNRGNATVTVLYIQNNNLTA